MRLSVLILAAAAALLPAAARAQWYSSYPGATRNEARIDPRQPYAIEVAPNTYVIHRPQKTDDDTRIICVDHCDSRGRPIVEQRRVERAKPQSDRPHKPANRALIEELERRSAAKRRADNPDKVVREKPAAFSHQRVINEPEKIVREKPVVITHTRVVNDPPRVVTEPYGAGTATYSERRPRQSMVINMDPPATPRRGEKIKHARATPETKRVIHAEAEVTILGPDRMSIRLYRKGPGDDTRTQ